MKVILQRPDGCTHALERTEGGDEMLTQWLEARGHPLNTRCGERGLCRGCLVQITSGSAPPQLQRACALAVADLPSADVRVQIPQGSVRDESLFGVTAFEIRHRGPLPTKRPGIGLAVDIGTTTVAAALWDFASGRCLADGATGNAQRRFGDDVVARISFAVDHSDGVIRLRRALLDQTLQPLIQRLCQRAGISSPSITECIVAGNPTMLHTFAGASLEGFARFPFRPVFLEARRLGVEQHGLPLGCPVDLLPGLGPFVGADIVAGALASGLLTDEGPVLLIDFGTNGEILLKHRDGYLATATAAGPAFEGGRLACGATARPGVISGLDYGRDAWQWTLTQGGNGQPEGISGAAYVDFIAVAAREGFINGFGRFVPGAPIQREPDAAAGAAKRMALSATIHVTEADIAELLQAKAAIAAGVATLLELAGLAPADLKAVYIAGGFGYHLRVPHAQAIGLMPAVDAERVTLIGNSSLGGASLLLHEHNRTLIEDLLTRTTVVELNQVPSFEDHFTDALPLP